MLARMRLEIRCAKQAPLRRSTANKKQMARLINTGVDEYPGQSPSALGGAIGSARCGASGRKPSETR